MRRELVEEAGYRAGAVEKLGEMVTAVGFCDEVVHLFAARGLVEVPRAPEADEFIEVLHLRLADALQAVADGIIRDGKTQLALLLHERRAARPEGRGPCSGG